MIFSQEIQQFDLVNILDLGARNDGEPPVYLEFTRLLPCHVLGIDIDEALGSGFCSQFRAPSRANYIAAFLGDGSQSDFYECRRGSVSSILPPSTSQCSRYDGLSEATEVIRISVVQTKKLSEVVGDFNADFVKTDLQGGDLAVLRHGSPLARNAGAILIEVDFIDQYANSYRFWEVAKELRDWGFSFHSFIDFGTRPLSGFLDHVAEQPRRYRQWLWANALFIAEPDRWSEFPSRRLLALASMMHGVFRSSDYAWKLLKVLDGRLGTQESQRFINLLRA